MKKKKVLLLRYDSGTFLLDKNCQCISTKHRISPHFKRNEKL